MDKALIERIIKPRDEKTQKKQQKHIIKRFWPTLKKASSHIPFMQDVVAAYFCVLDPTTPKKVRAILIAALAYFVLPFDLVPDILAVIGFSDDVAVLTFAIATVRSYMTDAHYQAAAKALFLENEDKNIHK